MLPTMKQALAEAVTSHPHTDQVKHLLSVMASIGEPAAAFARETLMERLGLQHRPTFRSNYLRPALEAGWTK